MFTLNLVVNFLKLLIRHLEPHLQDFEESLYLKSVKVNLVRKTAELRLKQGALYDL